MSTAAAALTPSPMCSAVEELGRVDSSVCITMAAHTSLGTMPIYLWGSEEQKGDGCRSFAAGGA